MTSNTSFTVEQLQAMLAQATSGPVNSFTAPTAPMEYVGPGGITFSTAKRIRDGLWGRTGYDENVTVSLHNGIVASLAMLKTTKRYEQSRPSDGGKGQDYYLIWEMDNTVGGKVADYLEQFPEAPKRQSNNRSGGNRQFSGGQQQSNSNAEIAAIVQQQLQAVLGQLLPQAPVPTVAPVQNHVLAPVFSNEVPAPTAPVDQDIVTVFPGQAIRCGLTGEVRYVSDAGVIRTNKTAG